MTLNKNMSPKIKWKLFAFMSAFTAAFILILWLLQIVLLNNIYRTIKVNEIKSISKELSSYSNITIRIQEKAESIAEDNGVCIIAYRMNKNGRADLLASCDKLVGCIIHKMSIPDLLKFYDSAKDNNGSSISYLVFDPKTNSYKNSKNVKNTSDIPEALVYSFIVQDQHGNDIFIVLNSVVSPVGSTVKTLNYLLGIVSLVMILLSCILTLILSKTITKPITDISRSAKKLASGNYDVVFDYGTYREINELSQTLSYAASELQKTERLRSELIANTSHDLRTPLTMITGYAEVMRDLPEENTPENAQIIVDEAKRLTSLVNDMLDISKLESGNVAVSKEEFDLTKVISEELLRYNELCRKEGYKIDFIYNKAAIVNTDRSKLIRALLNLINNALTYTGEDKTVKVIQEEYTDSLLNISFVRLSVIDTGEGIPPDKLELIWDRYYKLEGNHKRSANGSGLGLSIVNKLMVLLGGRCGVISKIGQGSVFFIEIPK